MTNYEPKNLLEQWWNDELAGATRKLRIALREAGGVSDQSLFIVALHLARIIRSPESLTHSEFMRGMWKSPDRLEDAMHHARQMIIMMEGRAPLSAATCPDDPERTIEESGKDEAVHDEYFVEPDRSKRRTVKVSVQTPSQVIRESVEKIFQSFSTNVGEKQAQNALRVMRGACDALLEK